MTPLGLSELDINSHPAVFVQHTCAHMEDLSLICVHQAKPCELLSEEDLWLDKGHLFFFLISMNINKYYSLRTLCQNIISLNPHPNPLRVVLFLSAFHKWGN